MGSLPLGERLAAAVPDRLPAAEECVVPKILERGAEAHPDSMFLVFEDGTQWTYADALAEASATAHALAALGVEQGDRVVLWLPNAPDILRSWFGATQLGGAMVPLNTAYKGGVLAHAVHSAHAEVAVVHRDLVPRLAEIEPGPLRRVIVAGDDDPAQSVPGVELLPHSALRSSTSTPFQPAQTVQPWDLQAVIYTSGTTGPSKGVLSSHFHLTNTAAVAAALHDVAPADRLLLYFPLFHVGGTIPLTAMMLRGASAAVMPFFNTKRFWVWARETQATVCWLTSNMANFLLKEPPSADDRNHSLRSAAIVHNGRAAAEFLERFGMSGVTMFNQTEANLPIVSEIDPSDQRFTGRLRPGLEARVVDEYDCEVADGEVGELVLRTKLPWALNHGYNDAPEATARSWRNGWWHTGDRFRRDEHGNFTCIDRINDTIRRRGESISPIEVENELVAFPAVSEAAVVGVPTGDDSNDVLAVVAPVEGATIDPRELFEFVRPRLAHFMLPRYIRVVPSLPTNNGRVIRRHLRDEGVTPETWDRDAAGYVVKRDRLQQ